MAIYERKETWNEQAVDELKNSYHAILTRIGEDPGRPKGGSTWDHQKRWAPGLPWQ